MAAMNLADIPNEVLTIYSREAIFSAFPQLYFRQFVKVKQEFQKEPGQTVQFLKINNLPEGGEELTSESSPIQKYKYSDSTVQVQVKEYGKAVQISRKSLEFSFRPMLQDASVLLGRNYGLVLDRTCRDSFLSTANKQYGGGVAGTANILAASVLSTAEIKDAAETLKTLNAPMVTRGGDQHYICISHPHGLRKLRDDSRWYEAHKYTTPEFIYNGESGRYENVIFLETTNMPIVRDVNGAPVLGADGQVVYRTIIFGADCVGFGETVPFGMVNDGVEDFGRLVSIGWYSIFGSGLINDYAVEVQHS